MVHTDQIYADIDSVVHIHETNSLDDCASQCLATSCSSVGYKDNKCVVYNNPSRDGTNFHKVQTVIGEWMQEICLKSKAKIHKIEITYVLRNIRLQLS